MWFAAHPPGDHIEDDSIKTRIGKDLVVSEDDVEKEFWRLVSSQKETVEVEYGADVHSTTHGRWEAVTVVHSALTRRLTALCPRLRHTP